MGAGANLPTLELHPLCTLFPRLAGPEFEALKADIIANGQREPITVHEGFVLDGGNRYCACIEAGIEPEIKLFAGADPVSFVLSANLHRRHLTPGQQAAIVASAQDWSRAHSTGGDRRSDQAATLPLDSVADRANQSGASERTQRMADKVARESPELAKQVAHGEISLPKALEQLSPKPSASAPRAPKPVDAITPPSSSPNMVPAAAPAPSLVQQVHDQQAASDEATAAAAGDPDEPAPEPDPFDQLLADFRALKLERDELQAKNVELEQHVALLTKDDLAAQVDGLVKRADAAELKFEQLSGRNRQLQQTAREAQLAQKSQADMLAKIRAALGVESSGEILPAITARRAA